MSCLHHQNTVEERERVVTPCAVCVVSGSWACPSSAAACLKTADDQYISLGEPKTDMQWDKSVLVLRYIDGELCPDKVRNRTTIIRFKCDKTKEVRDSHTHKPLTHASMYTHAHVRTHTHTHTHTYTYIHTYTVTHTLFLFFSLSLSLSLSVCWPLSVRLSGDLFFLIIFSCSYADVPTLHTHTHCHFVTVLTVQHTITSPC